MEYKIESDKLAKLNHLHLLSGAHDSFEEGACAMEAVSWLAGEPFSDHPACACPVLGAFVRRWNDSLNDEDRDRLVKPFVPKLVGTKSTEEVEERRAWLATDWLIRVLTPAFLELTPSLREHAATLSGLPPVMSRETALASQDKLDAAGLAARSAAWSAAESAAGLAVRSAAGSAAGLALKPTVKKLQVSASDLLTRMIEVESA